MGHETGKTEGEIRRARWGGKGEGQNGTGCDVSDEIGGQRMEKAIADGTAEMQ
jgi:hypothetical protein